MKNKKSQAILGYVLVVAVVVGAVIAMFAYVKRGLQGRYKEAADVFGQEEQYEPGVTEEAIESDESTDTVDILGDQPSSDAPTEVDEPGYDRPLLDIPTEWFGPRSNKSDQTPQ